MTPIAPSSRTSRIPDVLGGSAIVLLLGIVQVLATFSVRRPWTWSDEILITISWWLAWIPLVPLVAVAARHFAFAPNQRLRSTMAHALASLVFSLVHLVEVASIRRLMLENQAVDVAWNEMFAQFLGIPFFVFDIATYGGVVAALIAARFARAYREEELLAEQLRTQAADLRASVVQARLDALRMELNPHFLFNSLNAVAGLVGQNRNDEARETLGRLGALLRRTLSRETSHLTTVAREMELLDDFLFIVKVRFGDRIRFEITADASARKCELPTMILQPLVENAVQHGIEKVLAPGVVIIAASYRDDYLMVRVEDSGPGFRLSGVQPFLDEGIGLSNTRARLAQLYAGRASLSLGNRPEGGARVELRIPASISAETRVRAQKQNAGVADVSR